MTRLLRCHLFRLARNRSFWSAYILLAALSVFLTAAGRAVLPPEPCLWGSPMAELPAPTEQQLRSFWTIARHMLACGSLMFVPAVLCALYVCEDYTEKQLLPVSACGFDAHRIQLSETALVYLLTLGVLVLMHGCMRLLFWGDCQNVLSWLGHDWFLELLLAQMLFSLGTCALCTMLAAFVSRRELLLTLGLFCMAVDVLDLEPADRLLRLLPIGGMRGFVSVLSPGAMPAYVGQTLLLVILSLTLPVLLPSRLPDG